MARLQMESTMAVLGDDCGYPPEVAHKEFRSTTYVSQQAAAYPNRYSTCRLLHDTSWAGGTKEIIWDAANVL